MHRVALALVLCACGSRGASPPVDGGGAGGGTSAVGGGAGGGVSGTGGGNGLALSSACSTLNARRCEFYVRCGLLEDSDLARRDCAAWLLATWCGPSRWPARIEAKTLLYDSVAAQSCADLYTTRACTDFETIPSVCGRIALPNVSPAQSCYDGYAECTQGLVCRGAVCPRTCQPQGGAGGVCQLDSECLPPMYCRTTVAATGAGTCTPPGQPNALCSADEPCETGLSCIAGHCAVAPAEGMYCATGGTCDERSWCRSSPDGGVCTARAPSGEVCTDDVQCVSGLICQGTCVSKTVQNAGDPCSDRQACPKNTTCVGATSNLLGTCSTPLAAGAECIASDDCARPLACTPADAGLTLACSKRQPNHASCSLDRDCQILSRCMGGLCTRLPAPGQSCVESRACAAGPCVVEMDGGAFCSDTFGPGARCLADADCASNKCNAGVCLPPCAP